MCWAAGSGFVLARPASESPELVELDEDPELPFELFELPELELPQAATPTAQTADMSATACTAVVLRVIFSIVDNLPRTLSSGHATRGGFDRAEPRSLFPVARVSAGAITSR
jgi:hypothetical protein